MPESPPSQRGKWTVIFLITLGLTGAAIAYYYWTNHVTVEPKKPVGGDYDPLIAAKELAQLDDDLAQAKQVKRFNAILDKSKAFVAKYPKFAPAYTLLAKVYIELYEWPKAYDELKKSIELDSQQPLVHHLAGTMQYEMRDYEKAEEHYRTAHVLDANDPIHRVYLAQVFIRTNRLEEARTTLLEVLIMNDKSHEAYSTMCDLFMKQNDPTRALQQIDKALKATEAITNERKIVVPYLLKRSAVQRRANDPQGAMLTLTEQLLDHEQLLPPCAREIAETWGAMGKPEKAAEFYDRATTANPTEWQLIEGAVVWGLKSNNLELAKRQLRALEKLDPQLPVIKDLKSQIATAQAKQAAREGNDK